MNGNVYLHITLPESYLTSAIQKHGSVEAAVWVSLQKASENKGLNAFIHIDEDAAIKAAAESDTRRKNGLPAGI